MKFINFIWPRNINMSISCHIFLKYDQEADKNYLYSLNFVRTDLNLIKFIFSSSTQLCCVINWVKNLYSMALRRGNIPIFKNSLENT